MMYLRLLCSHFAAWGKTDRQLVRENTLLRYQLLVLRRKRRRIEFKPWDRPLLLWLSKKVSDWKNILLVVQPETLIRWHRKGFALYWSWRFKHKNSGRRKLPDALIRLIQDISRANPLWGGPRLHGEILKLGITVSQASVEKYMIRPKGKGKSTWRAFIQNHMKETVAIDFFVVPTIRFKMLWTLVVLSHDRRKILHTATTHKPSPAWTIQQLRETFSFEDLPRYLIRDRDRNFWELSRLGVEEVITSFRCPWQNGYVERAIGSIRRECTDHLIVFGERHLTRILKSYRDYYNKSRTHLALNKGSPISREVRRKGRIVSVPRVGGLHREFTRAAA